jgi:transposase-like protein
MKKCPRCHSSMLLDFADIYEAAQQVWRCMGCGREILSDAQEQQADDMLLARIRTQEAHGHARRSML